MRKILLIFCLYGIILKTQAQQTFNIVTENTPQLTQIEENISSKYLQRNVRLTLIYPKNISEQLPILFFNDGQDFHALQMQKCISSLLETNTAIPFLCVGIHANEDRIQEYGTASQTDYKQRGAKAKQHSEFVLNELLPYINEKISTKKAGNVIAGLSLGGLSAMDIGWNYPEVFSKIGVFSGALWWRQKSEEDGYTDENDRIIHNIVRNGAYKSGMKFWFEAGTNDEDSDRNNNGIIDAIDDTLDLMKELEKKGYVMNKDIIYEEVIGGEHNHHTWSAILPQFLKWAFAK
ncbi:enterochelin esterase-like enzyme [Arcicella aurantiaca]|uniref:Enterochelin esterase-like enzyme n=1 Tax=Arcicella aurantiaca TaxID=591202 RepID=A0A316DLC0_9BACT|nr:alpha/beta hydrolase-fold protein [Arcicella aurantiaca]PWK18861.1 enterochelin esterase-like enzyme [Arcicella aurantiaca]